MWTKRSGEVNDTAVTSSSSLKEMTKKNKRSDNLVSVRMDDSHSMSSGSSSGSSSSDSVYSTTTEPLTQQSKAFYRLQVVLIVMFVLSNLFSVGLLLYALIWFREFTPNGAVLMSVMGFLAIVGNVLPISATLLTLRGQGD
nr:MAG: hypothetical protein [Apis mellifra filamentous-like virus]